MNIKAKSLSEAWFNILYHLPECVYKQNIDRGSFAGGFRLQLPWLSLEVEQYEIDTIPIMPEGRQLEPPTTREYVEKYALDYLLHSGQRSQLGEAYTYASRMAENDQFSKVMEMLKRTPQTNQATIEIGRPCDIDLSDPACCRVVDFKIVDGKLNVSVFFRSWDIYFGLPSNLAGFAIISQGIAAGLEIPTGSMFAASPGAHIYHYQLDTWQALMG